MSQSFGLSCGTIFHSICQGKCFFQKAIFCKNITFLVYCSLDWNSVKENWSLSDVNIFLPRFSIAFCSLVNFILKNWLYQVGAFVFQCHILEILDFQHQMIANALIIAYMSDGQLVSASTGDISLYVFRFDITFYRKCSIQNRLKSDV